MDILLIHPNFPGQFRYLAQALAAAGEHNVVFLTSRKENNIKGVKKIIYNTGSTTDSTTDQTFGKAQAHGLSVYNKLSELVNDGFKPHVAYTHCGFGVSMFLKQILPDTPVMGYAEWFFDPHLNIFAENTGSRPIAYMQQAQQRNAVTLLELSATDIAVSPTQLQKQQFPQSIQPKIAQVYDGVDTNRYRPANNTKRLRRRVLAELDLQVPEDIPIITYVSRGMEPLRGFPLFVQALREAQTANKSFHTVIIGSKKPHYGPPPEGYSSYVDKIWRNSTLDKNRIHFTGLIDTQFYSSVLKISDLHIYLTRPFVLSWSLPEAMSTGCRIIASNTAPVQEFLDNGTDAHLVDYKNSGALAEKITGVLNTINSEEDVTMRKNARKKIVKKYSLKKLLPKQLEILYTTAASTNIME